MRLMIVEDEELLRTNLDRAFTAEGFAVDAFESGEEGLEAAQDRGYDLIVLDIGLPGMDGFEVVRALRGRGDRTPLVLLTSYDREEGLIRSLDLGADDFIRKPFSMAELQAHVRALLRRANLFQESTLHHGDLVMDLRRRSVTRGGKAVPLTDIQFKLLAALVIRRGAIASRAELLNEVWGIDFEPDTKVLDVQLTYLRKKLRTAGEPFIENVRGKGYRVVPEALS